MANPFATLDGDARGDDGRDDGETRSDSRRAPHIMTRLSSAPSTSDPPRGAHEGSVVLDPSSELALVASERFLALRDAHTLELLGETARLEFPSEVISVVFTARSDRAACVTRDGDAYVINVSRGSGVDAMQRLSGGDEYAFAHAWRALGGGGYVGLRRRFDASTTIVNAETMIEHTIAHRAKMSEDGDSGALRAFSRCGRWTSVVARDEDGREQVEVYASDAPHAAAITFRLPASADARAIEFGSFGEILVFDDPCKPNASPALRVFSSDGTQRAEIRGARVPYARSRDSLVVSTIENNREGLAWIDELTWRVVRAVEHPLRCDATFVTRCFRESTDGFEKIERFEQTTIACDSNGVERMGVRLAMSRCGTVIASACASQDDKVLFLWSASAVADVEPLALFVHRKPIRDFKWFANDDANGEACLAYVCIDTDALFSYTPGSETPSRAKLDCGSKFSPTRVVGKCGKGIDAFILASKMKTFTRQATAQKP